MQQMLHTEHKKYRAGGEQRHQRGADSHHDAFRENIPVSIWKDKQIILGNLG